MTRYLIIFEDDHMWETEADDIADAETKAYHFTSARIETIYEATEKEPAHQE